MVAQIGRWFNLKVKNFVYSLGFFSKILFETLFFLRRKQVGYKVLVFQILFTGFEALGIISLVSISIGAVVIIQGVSILPQFGQGNFLYTILITIITKELGPILTAFIIIARSGTAIATELGGMVVSHQIEAYESIGINPISYLVVPRFLGVTLSMLILNIYFNFVGLFGSFFITQLVTPIPFFDYFMNLFKALDLMAILSSLIKSFVFGIIISTVATYQGFNVKMSSTEIPQVVIKAVGQAFVFCIFADLLIILLFWG